MWVARDKNNNLHLWFNKPLRFKDGYWYNNDGDFIIDSQLFSYLKWEDEPIEVSLIETFKLQSLKAIK